MFVSLHIWKISELQIEVACTSACLIAQLAPGCWDVTSILALMLACCYLQFNSVNILSILIDSNQSDAETTKVLKIALSGTAGEVFNVAEIKKQEEKS